MVARNSVRDDCVQQYKGSRANHTVARALILLLTDKKLTWLPYSNTYIASKHERP